MFIQAELHAVPCMKQKAISPYIIYRELFTTTFWTDIQIFTPLFSFIAMKGEK